MIQSLCNTIREILATDTVSIVDPDLAMLKAKFEGYGIPAASPYWGIYKWRYTCLKDLLGGAADWDTRQIYTYDRQQINEEIDPPNISIYAKSARLGTSRSAISLGVTSQINICVRIPGITNNANELSKNDIATRVQFWLLNQASTTNLFNEKCIDHGLLGINLGCFDHPRVMSVTPLSIDFEYDITYNSLWGV